MRNLEFSLDWVFDQNTPQKEVYEILGRDRVARVSQGFNVCILAYGQTGSGKTHTMFGPDEGPFSVQTLTHASSVSYLPCELPIQPCHICYRISLLSDIASRLRSAQRLARLLL